MQTLLQQIETDARALSALTTGENAPHRITFPEAAALTEAGEIAGTATEHIPRLTERFYRIDSARSRATGGTGLGLSIVKHVLQRHDATLAIDSVPGQGACFKAEFPAYRMRKGAAAYPPRGQTA